jgi:DNA-binding MarR family transcriptional regulator
MVLFIDHLEREGWIRREANPEDRRSHAIVITRKGHEHLNILGPKLTRAESEALGALSASERTKLQAYLRMIIGS